MYFLLPADVHRERMERVDPWVEMTGYANDKANNIQSYSCKQRPTHRERQEEKLQPQLPRHQQSHLQQQQTQQQQYFQQSPSPKQPKQTRNAAMAVRKWTDDQYIDSDCQESCKLLSSESSSLNTPTPPPHQTAANSRTDPVIIQQQQQQPRIRVHDNLTYMYNV